MQLKAFPFYFFLLLLISCDSQQDNAQNANNMPPPPPMDTVHHMTPVEELRAQAFDEEDIQGRIEYGLEVLRNAYKRAKGKVPRIGDVTVTVDDDCNLNIRNEWEGKVYETKVNMRNLDPNNGFGLIPDNVPGTFPGMRIYTMNDAPDVEIYVDGELKTKNNEIVVFLETRDHIGELVPAMVQTIGLCHL